MSDPRHGWLVAAAPLNLRWHSWCGLSLKLVKVKLPDLGESTPQSSFPSPDRAPRARPREPVSAQLPDRFPPGFLLWVWSSRAPAANACTSFLITSQPRPFTRCQEDRRAFETTLAWRCGCCRDALGGPGAMTCWSGHRASFQGPARGAQGARQASERLPWAFIQAPWVMRAPGGGRQQL